MSHLKDILFTSWFCGKTDISPPPQVRDASEAIGAKKGRGYDPDEVELEQRWKGLLSPVAALSFQFRLMM